MIYFVRLDSSDPSQHCYLDWNVTAWGRCVFRATSFPNKEAAETALKEARESIRFLAPELLSKGLHERLRNAKVITFSEAASDEALVMWAPKGQRAYTREV